jgi:hypothetical protein
MISDKMYNILKEKQTIATFTRSTELISTKILVLLVIIKLLTEKFKTKFSEFFLI